MSVKYNKLLDKFEVRHYADLTNDEIIKGVDNTEANEKKLLKYQEELEKATFEVRRIKAEIEDLENFCDVIDSVTHIYNGVPIMESYRPISSDNPRHGQFSFSNIQPSNNRGVHAYTSQALTDDEMISNSNIWCFELFFNNEKELFMHNKGKPFDISFIKYISYEFVVNNLPPKEIIDNIDVYIDIHKRDNNINQILKSK